MPSNTPPNLWIDNTREYLHRYKKSKPPIYSCEKLFFQQLLADLKDKNIRTLVVEMPSLPSNRSLLPRSFWNEYKQWLSQTCRYYDASLCDLSDDPAYVKSHYLDTVHLNASGGNKIFKTIAKAIIDRPQLVAAIREKQVAARKIDSLEPTRLGLRKQASWQ